MTEGKSFYRVVLGTFLLVLLSATAEGGLSDRVVEKVLPNGLKILLLENHKAPVVTFQVWYRVGSRNEAWGKTGLSHVLEHMMFKGTEEYGLGEFNRLIQQNGGNSNAFTSQDYTAYFESLSSDRVEVPIDLESDRMHNLVLLEDDFQTERMVVMEERRLRVEDRPRAYLLEQVNATAFQLQPYHWPVIGWMQDLENLTLQDLEVYYRTYYNPANTFIVVVGDFEKKVLLRRIETAFGSIPKRSAPNQEKPIDPPQVGERRILVNRPAELPFLMMAYHVPNLREPESYVLEVVATLLSKGKSARLYETLVRKKRLASDVQAAYPLLSRDPDLFTISAEPLPEKELHDILKVLEQEMERLRTTRVGNFELEKAKNQLRASFVFRQDSFFLQALLLARYEIASGWRAIDDYIPGIRKVTAEDIMAVAKRYLVPENRTVGILVPLPTKENRGVPREFSIKKGPIQ